MLRSPRGRGRIALPWRWALITAAGAALFVAGCGDDDDGNPAGPAQVPSAWAGIWETTTIERDCETDELLSETTETDTLCTGEPVSFEDEGSDDVACRGTVTDTSIDVTCTSSFVVEGVTYELSITFEATRSGDSYGGTGRATLKADGTVVDCSDVQISGTRTGAAPADCDGAGAPGGLGAEFFRRAMVRG